MKSNRIILFTYENILILALMFLSFTQFRFKSLPIGIGEVTLICLGCYVIYTIIINKHLHKFLSFAIQDTFVRTWLVISSIMLVGYSITSIEGIHQSKTNVIHDFFAYGFVLYSIVIYFIMRSYLKINFDLFIKRLVTLILFFYALLLVIAICFGNDLGINGFYVTLDRFIGLSKNPNQIALIFTVIPFMILSFYKSENSIIHKDYTFLLLLLSLTIIYAIHSRGLIIAVSIAFSIIAYYKIYTSHIKYIKFLLHFSVVIIFCLIYVFYDQIIEQIFIRGAGAYTHRVELWGNAFETINQSLFFGFGTGAHVKSLVDLNKFWEVHNSFLDLTVQSGLLGLIVYLYLLFKIAKNLLKNTNIYLFAAFLTLILFSSFHFVLRHPIFWLYLYYFYYVGKTQYKLKAHKVPFNKSH